MYGYLANTALDSAATSMNAAPLLNSVVAALAEVRLEDPDWERGGSDSGCAGDDGGLRLHVPRHAGQPGQVEKIRPPAGGDNLAPLLSRLRSVSRDER